VNSPVKLLIPSACRSRRGARIASFVVIALLLMTAVLSAHAQSTDASFSLLNGVQAKFQPLQYQWGAKIKVYAQRLFWALAAVDFGWTCITYIIEKNDIGDMLGSLVRKVMTISFFFILLKMSDTWIPMIINSFTQIGQDAAGSSASSTPDQIVSTGWSTALAMYQAVANKGLTDKIAMTIPVTALSILCFLSFLFVAVQLLVTLIETYIAIGAGIIMLGFGGSRWTTDMASKYMQYAVATGVKLMVIYLIVGAGQTLFDQTAMIDANQIIKSCMTAMGAGFVYSYLAFQVPSIASSMMSGSPTMTAGGMMGAALTTGAAMAGAGAAAGAAGMSAAKGAAGAASGATGLAKALSAGVNSGLDLGKSGTALAAHALGQTGAHGLGLAKGAIGDAVGGAKSNFAQAVDKSVGGKIASSIEATRGGSVSGVPAPQASSGASQGGGASQAVAAPSNSGQGAAGSEGGYDSGASASDATQSNAQPVSATQAVESAGSPPASDSGSSAPSGAPSASGAASTSSPSPSGVGASSAGASSGSAAASSGNAGNAPSGSGSSGASAPSGSSSGAASAPPQQASPSAAPAASTAAQSVGESPTGASGPSAPSSAAGVGGDASTASLSGNNQPSGSSPESAPSQQASPSAAPAASTAAQSVSESPTGASGPSAPSSAAGVGGDASTASLSGSNQPSGSSPGSARSDPLHKRIQDLQGYIPQDSAHAASVNIDLKHAAD
jgi:type IV secretion system protein TrbL